MKNTEHNVVFGAIAALLVGVGGVGLYLLFHAFGSLFGGLDSGLSRLMMVGCGTLLLSSLIIARGLSRRVPPLDAGPAAKETLYERILSAWSAAYRRGGQPGGLELDELERHLVLRASKSVLNCYLGLRKLERPFDPSGAVTRSALQRLITEMRKDLGHPELPWSSAAAVDLLFRPGEPSERGVPGSQEFKVLKPQ